MRLLSPSAFFLLLSLPAMAQPAVPLVEEGRAACAIILPAQPDSGLRAVADSFVETVEKSTGARIEILTEPAEVAPSLTRLYLGPTESARQRGLTPETLAEEEYRRVGEGRALWIIGRDEVPLTGVREKPLSRPTRWALNQLLEEGLGVRWLWPGELGTYIPKHRNFSAPAGEHRFRPKLERRSLWMPLKYTRDGSPNPELRKVEQQAFDWAEAHAVGKHGEVRFGHAFGHWWRKYGKTNPDYFGATPPGFKQPFPRAERAKLRLANPAVIEQIAKEYEAAGAPDVWNICPNDGSGFDVSEETRAWDLPADQSPEQIWQAQAQLTARYVEFWNRIYARLRQINPEVLLCSYAYSAYKEPPPPERPLSAKMALGLVPAHWDRTQWLGWSRYNTRLFLRPNWWHYGSNAPYLPLRETDDFIAFARENGLHGIDMDSIAGYWATQGLNYYLVARRLTRGDLSHEEILGEYTAAFGSAAPKVREYIAYWQGLASRYRYGAPDGEWAKLIKEGKIAPRVSGRTSRHALPLLYPENLVAPGAALLAEARELAANDPPEVRARLAFLEDGLEEFRATRDLVALSQEIKQRRTPEILAEYEARSRALTALRERLTPGHAIWGDAVNRDEERRGVYFQPRITPPQP